MGMFKNYADRGEQFIAAVRHYSNTRLVTYNKTMQPLLKRTTELAKQIEAAKVRLHLEDKQAQCADLEAQLAQSEVWYNPTHAQDLSKQLASLKHIVDPWVTLSAQVNDIQELMDIGDDSLLGEFEGQIQALETEYEALRKQLLFDGEFDDHNAILRLSAGAGGTDAQDWTEMLERMYVRWAERAGMSVSTIERSAGEEARVKTVVIGSERTFCLWASAFRARCTPPGASEPI